MHEIFDKIILFLCCMTCYLFYADFFSFIIPVIVVLIITNLLVYFQNDGINVVAYLLYIVFCFFMPEYFIFLPLINYNIFGTKYKYCTLISLLFLMTHLNALPASVLSFTVIFLVLSFYLSLRTASAQRLKSDFNELRDESVEYQRNLTEKNRSLIENKDYEVNLAKLNERNRISKEIHDNVGHILSRSLLQLGALLVIIKDEPIHTELSSLKDSLSQGMDQIRNSIHGIYEESIDLYASVKEITENFSFCTINFDYDVTSNPSLQLKNNILAIIKEALANIIKHSNATRVTVRIKEHPAMYQIIVEDNGTLPEEVKLRINQEVNLQGYFNGIGLHNIADRVKAFSGHLNINPDHGFRIFITIPKPNLTNNPQK